MNNIEILDSIVKKYSDELDIIKNITPVNLKEENDKFIESFRNGQIYNPQYIYSSNCKLQDIKCEVEKLSFCGEALSDVYDDYKKYIIKSIELMQAIGNSKRFTDLSIDLFGRPNNKIKKEAYDILNKYDMEQYVNNIFDAKYLKSVFEDKLHELGVAWNVETINDMSSKVAVDTDKKVIFINNSVLFSENDVKRLLVHEIGTHVVRAENGSRQKYAIFQNGFPGSIETEEGLATYNEYKNNVLDIPTFKIYAGRVLAVDICLKNTFYESFLELSKYFCETDCIRTVSRVKRGLTDTSNVGAFTKDFVYLNGYYKIKENINSEVEKILYIGVVGLDNVEQISKLISLGEINL